MPRKISTWLVRPRPRIAGRFTHRSSLIFIVVHFTALLVLFLLTLSLRELNANTSHLLRHIVDQSNLTSIVFRSPAGVVGDWKDAPAVVLVLDDGDGSTGAGRLCDDTGARCWIVGRTRDVTTVEQVQAGTSSTLSSALAAPTSSRSTSSTASLSTDTTRSTAALSSNQGVSQADDGIVRPESGGSGPSGEVDAVDYDPDSEANTLASDGDESDDEDYDDDGDDDSDEDEDEDEDDDRRRSERSISSRIARRTINLSMTEDPTTGEPLVQVEGVGADNLLISQRCAMSFSWAIDSLDNLIREEIVLACFYIWIFILALLAVTYTSIPHLLAISLSLVLSSIWLGVKIHLSKRFMASFLQTVETHCEGTNVLPGYLASRLGLQVTTLILDLAVVGVGGWLSWRLRDHFGWETFQRIGASRAMRRMYTLILAMSIVLQLDVFVLVTFFALWLDQITYGVTHYYMDQCRAWQAATALLIVVLLPWLVTGWRCIRYESRLQSNIFIGCCILLLVGWGSSFSNRMFRIEFVSWAFFGALGVLAVVLTILSILLAMIRRTTFDKGLANYLEFDMVGEQDAAKSALDEKVDPIVIPATSLPTFSSAFPQGPVPPPRAMFPALGSTIPLAGGTASFRRPEAS